MRRLILLAMLLASCGVKGPPRPPVEPAGPVETSSTSRLDSSRAMLRPVMVEKTIGTATMKRDGTIVLKLRAEDGRGAIGDALLEYPPSHPSYQAVILHLGGIRPGEEKPVAPWNEA